jgi:DNA-binding response OmpR family regulator
MAIFSAVRHTTAMKNGSYSIQDVMLRADPCLKVVVVENDKHLLRLYEVNIALWPLSTHFTGFCNGHDALVHLGGETPDLLIVDLLMPHLSGFELLNALFQAFDMHATKIVVVSGLDHFAIDELIKLPATVDILSKPISFAKLLDIATGIQRTKYARRYPPSAGTSFRKSKPNQVGVTGSR